MHAGSLESTKEAQELLEAIAASNCTIADKTVETTSANVHF